MRSTPPLPPRPLTVGHEHEPPTGATGRGSCVSGEAGSVSGTDVAHEQVANGLGGDPSKLCVGVYGRA